MKFSTTLSLIIGSFFVAVQGQGITADISYELRIAGAFGAYYELSCNDPSLSSNHPQAIEACQELEGYVIQAQTTGQSVSALLDRALEPRQPIQNLTPCDVIGGQASLNIIFMKINNEVIGVPYNPRLSTRIYDNGCLMKMIAEQGKLSHLFPFFETNSLPVPPLNN